jgi:enterochelin esterase-like enzyme
MYYSAYGSRAMTYDPDSGCWTLTLDLASANMGLLCYHDVKQSDLKDLSVPDGSTIQIPYDEVKQSKSFDWTLTAKNEQAGTVTTKTIEAADGTEIQLAIYTPYGYDPDDTSVNYPVVYLIPGMQTQYNTWFTGGYADRIFDNLIANETIAPTIVVTMTRDVAKMDYNDVWDSADDRSKQNGDGDGYINYNGESGSGTENMIHSRVVTDVIPYIDANYNTVADAAHRAIAGTSMGGVATTQIWLTDSDLFDYYGFFSGCDMYFKDADDAKAADEYKALKDTYKADYESLLSVIKESMDGVKIVVGGGITDRNAFGGDQNSAGADNLDAWLTENNIDHTYSIVGGGHDWTTWTQLLVQLTDYMAEDDSGWNVEESTAALEVISNDLFGTADTEGFSTLKKYTDSALTVPGDKVSYTGQAVLALTAKDGTAIDPAKIDISGAYVTLDAGDGYSVEDLIFSGASNLTLSKDGQLIYTLNEGDLEWNNYGYPVEEGGLEWSCIGGNGNGEYYFNLSVHGVKYDGKDADSISFRAEVYIYGREFSSQSSPNGSSTTSWGAGGYNDLELPVAKEETLGATNTSGDPEWTWVGDDTAGKPILCDTKTDNFYITWPEGLDASGLTEDDVVITLRSQYGDEYVLTPTTGTRLIEENGVEIPNGEFNVFSSAGETQISINLVVWAATPVYNTMTIEVKTDKVSSLARAALDSTISKTYDVASVYTHMVQLGGGLDLSGKTVTCVSVFGIDGIENLTLEDVYTPVQYYYAVTNGERGPKAKELYFLIDNGDKTYTVTTDKSEATFYPADTSSNTQLLGHTIFTTDINGDDGGSINVEYNGETLCFTRKVNYGNAAATNLLDPKAAGLEASAGYILTDNGTYDDHQRWAWLYLNNKGWLAPTEETPSEDDKQETPSDDKQETPADDKQETPADDKQETPADDKQETPADDKHETPADDKQETPADDKQETPADNQTTVIGSETTKKPTTNVKTGDVQNPAVWAALALASLSSALGAFFLRKKSK